MKTITKLAISSAKSTKTRSILTGIAIFLTTLLITIVSFGANSIIQVNLLSAADHYGEYFGSFSRITPEQENKIRLHAQFYNVGIRSYAAEVICKGYRLNLFAMDSTAQNLAHMAPESGSMPESENEILAQREFFGVMGYENPKIGDTVSLPVRINGEGEIITQEFVISGFSVSSKSNNLAKQYGGYVSMEFMEKQIPDKSERNTLLCFQVANEEKLGHDGMKEKINTLAADIGITEQQISINDGYLTWALDPGREVILPCICILSIIVLVAALVIYNIFHVSVVQKIREYGRLKALGASQKQLKELIHKEGLFLTAAAAPAGILTGVLILKLWLSVFFQNISVFSFPLTVLTIALVLATVFVSMHKPVKLAAKTSPVEAIRYEAGGKELSRKGRESLHILGLTMSNLSLHKKRTATTILTMGLSCILYVVVANLVGNMNPQDQAREDLEYGKFRIEIDGDLNDKTYPENNLYEIQKQNILGDDFISQIQAIEGVTEVRTRKLIEAQEFKENASEDIYNTIAVLSEEEFAWLQRNKEQGDVDYQNTAANDGVIFMWEHFREEEGYQIGSKFQSELFDGDRRIPFTAPIVGSCGHSNDDATWVMTEDTFEKLGISGDMTSILFVDCTDEAEDDVKTALENLVMSTDHLSMKSFSNTLALLEYQVSFMKNISFTFFIILAVIGFMNMANTMITNILTRKREFGVMQAIGMSSRQLNQMLQLEGLVFTAGTLLVSLSLGNILGYYAFLWCKKEGYVGLFIYRFPILENICLILGITVLQLILAFVLSKNIKKESIVERIRHEE